MKPDRFMDDAITEAASGFGVDYGYALTMQILALVMRRDHDLENMRDDGGFARVNKEIDDINWQFHQDLVILVRSTLSGMQDTADAHLKLATDALALSTRPVVIERKD